MKVGVLALQGDVREHVSALIACGVEPISVRRLSELEVIDALVIPGGESTTIAQLSEVFGIYNDIKRRIYEGMPVFGSHLPIKSFRHKIRTPSFRTRLVIA